MIHTIEGALFIFYVIFYEKEKGLGAPLYRNSEHFTPQMPLRSISRSLMETVDDLIRDADFQ